MGGLAAPLSVAARRLWEECSRRSGGSEVDSALGAKRVPRIPAERIYPLDGMIDGSAG